MNTAMSSYYYWNITDCDVVDRYGNKLVQVTFVTPDGNPNAPIKPMTEEAATKFIESRSGMNLGSSEGYNCRC